MDGLRFLVVCSRACQRQLGQYIKSYLPGDNLTTSFLDRVRYGQAAWPLLHAIAAAFPVAPTLHQQRQAHDFMVGFARMLPCGMCRGHFAELVRVYPWRVESRAAFSQWACNAHNNVNQSLGKPLYNCAGTGISSQLMGPAQCYCESLEPRQVGYQAGDNLAVVSIGREELGRATWLVLHSMAAYYDPAKNRRVALNFHQALAALYPCKPCSREYMLEIVQRTDLPLALASRTSYERWTCDFHNRINAQLGKPVYRFKAISEQLQFYQCHDDEEQQDWIAE